MNELNGRYATRAEERSAQRYDRLLELMEEGVPLCDDDLCDVCKDQV